MIEARIVENLAANGYDITIFERRADGFYVASMEGPPFTRRVVAWRLVVEGEAPRPTMTMRRDMLAAFVEAAEGVIPVEHATERHLLREIAVSDRLLALVERLTP